MENTQGANGQTVNTPAGSPPENVISTGMGTQPSAETLNTEGQVPYHERLNNDPGFKSYIDRMYEKRAQEQVEREVAYRLSLQQQSKIENVDPLEEVVQDLNKKLLDGKGDARDIFNMVEKTVTHKIQAKEQSAKQASDEFSRKVAMFQARHPESGQYQSKMVEIMNSLSPNTQRMIRESDEGLDLLLDKAKLSVGMISTQRSGYDGYGSPVRGTSSAGRSQSPTQKMGLTNDRQVAAEALKNGDKATYETIMRKLSH